MFFVFSIATVTFKMPWWNRGKRDPMDFFNFLSTVGSFCRVLGRGSTIPKTGPHDVFRCVKMIMFSLMFFGAWPQYALLKSTTISFVLPTSRDRLHQSLSHYTSVCRLVIPLIKPTTVVLSVNFMTPSCALLYSYTAAVWSNTKYTAQYSGVMASEMLLSTLTYCDRPGSLGFSCRWNWSGPAVSSFLLNAEEWGPLLDAKLKSMNSILA